MTMSNHRCKADITVARAEVRVWTLSGHPPASHVAPAKSVSALSKHSFEPVRCPSLGMRNAAAGIYRLYRCRRGVAGRGSRAAVGDIQKENDSFISVGASTSSRAASEV